MPQTRGRSFIESLVNTSVGLVISVFTWQGVAWLYSIPTTNGQTLGITAIFTLVSIVRGYCIRRLFNRSKMPIKVKDGTLAQDSGTAR